MDILRYKINSLITEGEAKKRETWTDYPQWEEAAECFAKAGNCCLIIGRPIDGAKLFAEAAACYLKVENFCEAAHLYIKEGKCHEIKGVHLKSHRSSTNLRDHCQRTLGSSSNRIKEKEDAYLRAIEILTGMGQLGRAAEYHQELASNFETIFDFEKAIQHLNLARDYYREEGMKNEALFCDRKLASIESPYDDFFDLGS